MLLHEEQWEPDWADLNDYVLFHHPELYQATKYLTDMSVQIALWRDVYERDQRKLAEVQPCA